MGDLIGKSLGRYQVIEQLGAGGMATVYKSFDASLERYVAIKVIRTDQGRDKEFYERFRREAKALAKLSHPNIVKVLDYGEHEGMPFLVMEFIAGGALKRKAGVAMPWQEAARLLVPIARALEYAHKHNIIHRDVKPANFLISESGQPMLSDFGISKILESDKDEPKLTETGYGIGTPDYLSPEQGLGLKIDKRADIYSLGVVFYELVTGSKPFTADTPLAVMLKQVHDPLPPPKTINPNLPDAVEQVLLKALAKKPEFRYQDMGEFADVLEKLAAGKLAVEPQAAAQTATMVLQPEEGVAEKAGKEAGAKKAPKEKVAPRSRRNRVILIAVIALVVVCCAGLWAMYVLNICLPPGPWLNPPWCGVEIPADYNRLICPPPGPWPNAPWCG